MKHQEKIQNLVSTKKIRKFIEHHMEHNGATFSQAFDWACEIFPVRDLAERARHWAKIKFEFLKYPNLQ